MTETLQAGLELDRLVAESIGLPMVPAASYGSETLEMIAADRDAWSSGSPYFRMFSDKIVLMQHPHGGSGFSPSACWSDVMLVVENCCAVYSLVVERTKNLDWRACIGGETAYAPTGPHAICLAILKLKAST